MQHSTIKGDIYIINEKAKMVGNYRDVTSSDENGRKYGDYGTLGKYTPSVKIAVVPVNPEESEHLRIDPFIPGVIFIEKTEGSIVTFDTTSPEGLVQHFELTCKQNNNEGFNTFEEAFLSVTNVIDKSKTEFRNPIAEMLYLMLYGTDTIQILHEFYKKSIRFMYRANIFGTFKIKEDGSLILEIYANNQDFNRIHNAISLNQGITTKVVKTDLQVNIDKTQIPVNASIIKN